MKYTLMLFALLGLYQKVSAQSSGWIIQNESYISIKGSSNINTFTCDYTLPFPKNPMSVAHDQNVYNFEESIIELDVASFDCEHRRMTNDFRATMDVLNHPTLYLEILRLKLNEDSIAALELSIVVAGKEKENIILLDAYNLSDKMILLEGSQRIRMSDFGLDAPSALWGMIKVDDSININFHILLHAK